MKLNKIAAACGLAVAALSSQAFAHGPSVTPDVEVFLSGSSAMQGALGKIAEGMMTAGTIDVYKDTTTAGKDYRAYFGTVSGTGTALDGKKVLMHNRANGGSIMGVNPVAQAIAITDMKIDSGCTAVAGAVYPAATYQCPNKTTRVPDVGVSDVEPALFVGANLPPTGQFTTALNANDLANMTSSSQNAVVFGIAVNDKVALTNLSRSQITALLTGSYQNWNMVDPSLGSHFVRVERRGAGSGTQASANAYFGGFPCSSAAVTLADASFSVPGVYEVVENSSTGNVIAGLNADYTAGKYSIGLVSTENAPVVGTDHWHFVSIDGVPATVDNAMNGKYDYFVEQSMQYRNTTVNGVAAPSGNVALFIDTYKARAGSEAVLSTLPGVAATPLNDTPTIDAVTGNVTNRVMKGTKLNNTCSPTAMFY